MSVSLSLYPHTDHLDMYGEPDVASAYSLSGHVSISLSPSSSFFDRRQTARYLLQSLSLTFDGQAEIFTPTIGYSAVRLCSVTRELAPSEDTLELTNEGHEESGEPCIWNIIFNITLPGWLPATSIFGVEQLGVSYGLYATAKLFDLDDNRNSSWGFATFCAPFLSKAKTASARKAVQLRRFAAPPSVSCPILGTINYQVNSPSISAKGVEKGKKRIPPDVLEKIQVVLSVPEIVDMSEKKVVVTLRMKSNGLDREERQRIRLLDVSLTLNQIEKCRTRPSNSYQNRYPLPPEERQPPNEPLFNPSPTIGTVYEVSIMPITDRRESTSRSFSLIPAHDSGQFKLAEEQALVFAHDPADPSDHNIKWYNLEMTLPFSRKGKIYDDWDIPPVLRPTASTPLFVVYHELTVAITCSYAFPDSDEAAQEKLSFTVPLSFGQVAPQPPRPPLLPSISHGDNSHDTNVPSLPVVEPYAPTLPVYSQLYDANGESKFDYSVPLPLYTPPSPQDEEEATDDCSARRMSISAVVDILSEEDQARRKGNSVPQSIEGDETDDEETSPLLGASTT